MQMEIYRFIAIIVAIIAGIINSRISLKSEEAQQAIKDPIIQKDYEILQKNAIKFAKTLDISIVEEGLTVDYHISDEKLSVIVESYKAKLIVKIPILIQKIKNQEGIVKIEGIAKVEKAEYEVENKIESKYKYIIDAILFGLFTGFGTYILLLYTAIGITKLI